MHVTASSSFAAAIRPEMTALVRSGFAGVECHDVEVHVKARSRVQRWYRAVMLQPDGEDKAVTIRWARRRSLAVAFVGDRRGWVDSIRRPAPRANAWGARTYDGVPSVASVRAGTRYLVTINMAADPAGCAYPQRHRYPRLRALGGPGAGSMA